MSWFEAASRWYLVLVAITLAFAPATRYLTSRLPDRGATIARPLSLLLFLYPAWLLASLDLVPFNRATLVTFALPVAVVSWIVAARRRWITRSWLSQLAMAEAIALLTFAVYLWLVGFKPDIFWSEKPMDAAFIASSARSESVPVPDPWLSGETINYYYLGHLLLGTVMRMAAVDLGPGFNLSTATLFSMSAVAAAGFGFNAVRTWWSRGNALIVGAAASFLLLVSGNLLAPKELIQRPSETLAADWRGGVGWSSIRVVTDPGAMPGWPPRGQITEFPFAGFLMGVPHAQLQALPFTLTALGLILQLMLTGLDGAKSWRTFAGVSRIAATAFVVGALYPINSWDYPTYLAIALAGLQFALHGATWRIRAFALCTLIVISIIAWLPFTLTYQPPHVSDSDLPNRLEGLRGAHRIANLIRLVTWERTSLGEFLTMFGIPFAVAACFLGLLLVQRRPSVSFARQAIFIGVLLGGLVLVSGLFEAPLVFWCGALLAASLTLLRVERQLSPASIATSTFAIGFTLVLTIEFVCFRDANLSRTNTMFKVYIQAWTLFSVASAIALMAIWFAVRRMPFARITFSIGCAFLTVAAFTYPAIAAYRWTEEFGDWRGIDGLAYVGEWSPDELNALRWLQANAELDDVVLEAAGCSKLPEDQVPSSRVSAFTGVPTIIGWGSHERIWRHGKANLEHDITTRQDDVRRMYEEPSGPEVADYGVTLLYVGRYEQGAIEDCKFAGPYTGITSPEYPGSGWIKIFESGEVRIFRRMDAS